MLLGLFAGHEKFRCGQGSQSLFRKSSAGSGLEILFEIRRLITICQGYRCFDLPRTEFCGVRDIARVGLGEPGLQIRRQADIESLGA